MRALGWLRRALRALRSRRPAPVAPEPWDYPTREMARRRPTPQPIAPPRVTLPGGRHRGSGRASRRGRRTFGGAHSIRVLGTDAWDRLHAYLIWAERRPNTVR